VDLISYLGVRMTSSCAQSELKLRKQNELITMRRARSARCIRIDGQATTVTLVSRLKDAAHRSRRKRRRTLDLVDQDDGRSLRNGRAGLDDEVGLGGSVSIAHGFSRIGPTSASRQGCTPDAGGLVAKPDPHGRAFLSKPSQGDGRSRRPVICSNQVVGDRLQPAAHSSRHIREECRIAKVRRWWPTYADCGNGSDHGEAGRAREGAAARLRPGTRAWE